MDWMPHILKPGPVGPGRFTVGAAGPLRSLRCASWLAVCWWGWLCVVPEVQIADAQEPTPAAGSEIGKADDLSELQARQRVLAEQYRMLEDKLFTLSEYEKSNDPDRAAVLQQALEQSQQQMTAGQMARIVELMNSSRLKQAEDQQQATLQRLSELLEVLQRDDPGMRLRKQLAEYRKYAQEVNRLLQRQQGIRGQAEGGVPLDRLSGAEGQALEQAGQLEQQMTEPPSEADATSRPGGEPAPARAQPSPNEDKEALRQPMAAARERMKQAREALERAERDQAVDRMRAAEQELEKARRELARILRQLREEEVGQMLARLEDRFREMLDRQVRVNESTRQLNETPEPRRGTEFEIRATRLSGQQQEIGLDAGRALRLLQEDGSSVAFPVTVEEIQEDMQQVADRLRRARINAMTLGIQDDIVESLNQLVEALVASGESLEESKSRPPSPGQSKQPGAQALVDQLSELKMLRGLQERIHRRHQRYAEFLEQPDDPVGTARDPDVIAALQRLAKRQAQLVQITRELVDEQNQ